jgi:hypothetical protein
MVGAAVGAVGAAVGVAEGAPVGSAVGAGEGLVVGAAVGTVGAWVGSVGACEGAGVGCVVGPIAILATHVLRSSRVLQTVEGTADGEDRCIDCIALALAGTAGLFESTCCCCFVDAATAAAAVALSCALFTHPVQYDLCGEVQSVNSIADY